MLRSIPAEVRKTLFTVGLTHTIVQAPTTCLAVFWETVLNSWQTSWQISLTPHWARQSSWPVSSPQTWYRYQRSPVFSLNDKCPIALTQIVANCFQRLVIHLIKTSPPNTHDPVCNTVILGLWMMQFPPTFTFNLHLHWPLDSFTVPPVNACKGGSLPPSLPPSSFSLFRGPIISVLIRSIPVWPREYVHKCSYMVINEHILNLT